MRAENREGRKGIEAAPGSIEGDAAGTSAAAAAPAPTIIITTTKRATYAEFPVPAILAHSDPKFLVADI